ncbi:MAG: ribosomal protection-like ABC-F family protein [bacterium]|jgi:ATP-binding cassette subfamily F protein 3
MLAIVNGELRLGGKVIFSGLNWRVDTQDRVGLVGPNGAGKTSILRVLTGEYALESGSVESSKNQSIGYLPQESSDLPQCTIGEEFWKAFETLNRMEEELNLLLHQVEQIPADSPEHQKTLERYGHLQEEFQEKGGYARESEARKVLIGLGFKNDDWDRPLQEFSGGWRMRVFLGKLLLQKPDILLLDEPTNHLDPDALAWFESYLNTMNSGLVIVSHDRFFLDRMVKRIVEIENKRFETYVGNYSEYKRQKEIRREQLLAQRRNQEREIAHLQEFVDRFKAKATKAAQAQSRIKRIEKIDLVEIEESSKKVSIPMPETPRSGNEVLHLEQVGHCYGSFRALYPFTTTIIRGDRVGVWGPNGAGKSTLLSIMAGEFAPSEGHLRWGHNTHVAYFSQHHAELQTSSNNVLDELSSVAPAEMQTRLRDVLGAFLFSGDDVLKNVSVLSGGEKSRLALAKLLIRPVNVFILDEPLNHLDISTIEILEETLQRFSGTIIFVSHDRYFIDRLANQVWEMREGRTSIYPGTFQDFEYMKQLQAETQPSADTGKSSVPEEETSSTSREARKEQKRREAEERNKLSKVKRAQEQKCQEVESKIHEVETEIDEIEALMSSPDYANRNGEEMARINKRYKELLTEKDRLYVQWEEMVDQLTG